MSVTTTRMGAALDALVALATASTDLAGVTILDGPSVSGAEKADTQILYIGAQTDEQDTDVASVTGAQQFRQIAARVNDETFSIHCVAAAWTGDTVMKTARDLAFAVLSGMELALRATNANQTAPTLNGAVTWSRIGAQAIRQQQTPSGAACRIDFDVDCYAYLNQT